MEDLGSETLAEFMKGALMPEQVLHGLEICEGPEKRTRRVSFTATFKPRLPRSGSVTPDLLAV